MLDIDKLKAYRIPDTHTTLTKRDAMLYALGVGIGGDPADPNQLQFVYERGLRALPTMATIIASPYRWIGKADVGWSGKSVHAGVFVELRKELPVEGEFIGQTSIGEILDKGPGRAAVVTVHRKVFDATTRDPVFDITWTNMYQGDGGFGGRAQSAQLGPSVPPRVPDEICDLPTIPQQGLIYRLSGDYNPLHGDPEFAQRHGFPKAILHGLSTFGVTGHALIKTLCGYDPSKLRAIGGRFSKPVYPGECLRVKMWVEGVNVVFQTTVPSRQDEIVVDFGSAKLT